MKNDGSLKHEKAIPTIVIEHIASILNQARNGITITDPNQEDNPLIYVNEAFLERYGHSYEEVIGRNPRFLQGDDREQQARYNMANAIAHSEPIIEVIRNYSKSGDIRYTEVSLTPIYDNNKVILFLGIQKDVTSDIELKEQQAKYAALGSMLGNIIHQWKQPINNISLIKLKMQMCIDLGDDISKEMIYEELNKIDDQIKRLTEISNTFKNYLKKDKTKQKVILQNVINEAVGISKTLLDSKHIGLDKKINNDNVIQINIVPQELIEVIVNIINNAMDAIEEKSVIDPVIKIVFDIINDVPFLTIEDNAGGIPEDVLPHIFDEYYSTKSKDTGTGLGLHMSKKIVTESLGGKIYAQNTINGAKFIIEFC